MEGCCAKKILGCSNISFLFFLFSLSAHLQLTFTGFFHKNGTFAESFMTLLICVAPLKLVQI